MTEVAPSKEENASQQVDDSPCTLAIEGVRCVGWTNSASDPLHDIGGFKLCFIFQLASHFGGCQTTGDIFVSLRVLPWLILMLTLEKCPSSLERENMYMQCNADRLDSY